MKGKAMGIDDPRDGAHPCEQPGCTAVVPYDDEPYCYTHSPDSGSTVPGYSYHAKHNK